MEAHVEDDVLRELLRTFGGKLARDYGFEGAPLTKTMLEQLTLLHDAELSKQVHKKTPTWRET
jgi:hypothetical protein